MMPFRTSARNYPLEDKRLQKRSDRSLKREMLIMGGMLLAGLLNILLII